mmetsp:Transcript_36492/g.40608  ORF Transcript_36492/g.40608 Transcript_36492/m.40608 type:complete len:513 (+) Transcript_36492:131-1669(+)
MVSFTAAASVLVLLASTANASYEMIANYEPQSQVTDHNAIDLDQEAMENQLALANEEAYANALAIYSLGAHSKSSAKVTLVSPLASAATKGTKVTGRNADGNQVVGKLYEDVASGATEVLIQYQTSDIQKSYVTCQVGASQAPMTDGCFEASGTVDIDGIGEDLSYTYDVLTDNINKRSIQGFSTGAQKKMAECDNCPYKMYQQFYNYYGQYDYANQIVLAAFSGSKTNFDNFNNDFGLYGFDGKEQVIKKATSYIVIWMYVIREMEDALDDCQEACTIENCNDDPVHAWDEGVAFYTGTLEGPDGSGSGKLPYALADKRCPNFKTCGDMGDETTGDSHVNIEIMKQFAIGQSKLVQGQCDSAREQKETIEELMLVPLIQGTIRYAWKTDNEGYSEKAEAEGLVFAAAVLPAVHECDPDAAKTIADNLQAGQAGTANSADVKAAFESTYECMNVNPEHVGGLYDAASADYFEGAEPMGYTASNDSGAATTAATTFTAAAVVVVALTSLFIVV